MRQTFRIGTFFGVDVGVNWSVLVIFVLLAWELADLVFPGAYAGSRAAYWSAGVLAALVFLLSLLAHEISHAVVARHNGVGVRSITLWLFGGVAQLQGEAHTAGADFRIAAVGPGTSVAMAVLFGGAQLAVIAAGAHGLPVGVLSWLWKINLLLAGFNLVPAAPLDGGRMLRAGLWRAWGDRTRAQVAAARAGRVFGAVLIALGVVGFAAGNPIGLWPAVLGWFLYTAAGAEERMAEMRGGVAHLLVGQVMTSHPPAVPARLNVAQLISDHLWHYRGDALAVTDGHGWLAGAVTVSAVRAVPAERRLVTPLSEIALPLSTLAVSRPEEPMASLLERMTQASASVALVLDAEHRLAGIVTPGDIERAAAFGPMGSEHARR
jgi:Zn-dependent protease